MNRFLAAMLVALLAAPAMAQPWYARGEFNGWSQDNIMTQDPMNPIHWTTTVGGLFANSGFQYKIACCGTDGWAFGAPGGNGKVTSNSDNSAGDGTGSITFHMWDQTTWNDGWYPNAERRVGYNDPLQYTWEVMGSFDGWSTGIPMVAQGNGVYSVDAPFNTGVYDFKFRKAGDWDINMGNNFANGSNNNQLSVASNGDTYRFELDLPNGRWRVSPVSVNQYGDFNGDGFTNAADYVVWRNDMPTNSAKYTEWRSNFGHQTVLSWIAHGSFGADVTLTDQGGGVYGTTLTGLTAGTGYDVSVLRSDASSHFPGSPAKVTADASGNIDLKLYQLSGASWGDGWQPDNQSRFGYVDSQQFGWEVIGSFNGWPAVNDPAFNMTAQGNGLYTGSFAFATPGTFDFKFRKQGDWSTSIGNDFGNSAGNNSFTVANAGDTWNFELDLLHGKWRAYHPAAVGAGAAVPEPTSVALVLMGLALGLGRVRRK